MLWRKRAEMLRGWCYFYITFEQVYVGGYMGRAFKVEGGGRARTHPQGLVGHLGKFVFSSSEMEARAPECWLENSPQVDEGGWKCLGRGGQEQM